MRKILDTTMITALLEVLRGHHFDKDSAEWVFTNAITNRLDASKIRKVLKNNLEKAGLRHIRFHDLRHTHMLPC